MRIVSGELKGRIIRAKIPAFIRPTTDKVREAIFNILENHISFENKIIADICAGTGMLGFEAISRGCLKCHFVDKNIQSVNFIKSSAAILDINENLFKIYKNDALKFLKEFNNNYSGIKFDLIFTDPPYKANFLNRMVELINIGNLLAKKGIFVAEHDDTEILLFPENWQRLTSKTYGITQIEIYQNKV